MDRPRFFGGTSGEANRLRCPTEAYVCTACGYLEEYVVGVADVDWSLIPRGVVPAGEPDHSGPFQ
ncbi:MAG: hypothetical protein AB8I08_37585 [Sandaracinaceae bacterium]